MQTQWTSSWMEGGEFIEFSEFSEIRECDKSLKQRLGSTLRSCLSHVSCWCCDSIQVSYTRGGSSEPFCLNDQIFLSLKSLNSVKHLVKINSDTYLCFTKNELKRGHSLKSVCDVSHRVLTNRGFSLHTTMALLTFSFHIKLRTNRK